MNILESVSLLGKFWQEKINGLFFRWTIFFVFLELLLIVYRFGSLPSQVPLYYSLPWGEDRLAPFSSLFLLPTFVICITLINNLFAIFYQKTIPLLSRLLVVSSCIFSFFSFIAIYKIVSIY